MKSIDEIVAFIARRIGEVYYGQLMFGFSGKGVDQFLFTYHELWAEIMDCREELKTIYRRLLRENRCATAGFPKQYSLNNPEASEEEIAQYVVNQWRKISECLGVPIPHDELKN